MKTLNIRLALTVLVLTLFMGMALTVSAEDRINISTCNATVSPASQVYTGNAITYTTDQLTVTDPNGKILSINGHYYSIPENTAVNALHSSTEVNKPLKLLPIIFDKSTANVHTIKLKFTKTAATINFGNVFLIP